MKIITIVGARPQFIKAAVVSKELRKEQEEIIVHTGQHYDANMSDSFFEELEIPKPKYNLAAGSGTHAQQTAKMLVGIEEILMKEQPDYTLLYGDTNSTLAGSLASSKILVPIIHVEAGLRSYNKKMPEEQNRVVTDHLSKVLFCPTDNAINNLALEGIVKNVFLNGDVMCDAVMHFGTKIASSTLDEMKMKLEYMFNTENSFTEWYLATVHRAENTDDIRKLEQILFAFEQLDKKVIFTVHPRTQKLVNELIKEHKYSNIIFVKPLGYTTMLYFMKNAVKVITDSGGLQKEAFILNTRCITIREQTEWIETLENQWNILSSPEENDIIAKVLQKKYTSSEKRNVFGNGDAAKIMCTQLKDLK